MSEGPQSGFVPREHPSHPLLLVCDARGKVLWVSQRTREVWGEPSHLSDLVLVARPQSGRVSARFRILPWQFRRILELRDSVVVLARPPQSPDVLLLELLRLQSRLVRGFFRLVIAERKLADGVRRKRGGTGGRRLLRQIEFERQRLGRELHTGVGQALAAIRLQLEIIGTQLTSPPPQVQQALDSIASLSGNALDQVRTVSRRLHPPEWQRLPLEEAIRQLWDLSGVAESMEGKLEIEPLLREPVPEVKALIYRATQEALSNLVRHAQATRVEASLRPEGERVVLTISDNGIGFDVNRFWSGPARVGSGIGLRSIREQVATLGGKFDMESGPLGTKLVVSVVMSPSGF